MKFTDRLKQAFENSNLTDEDYELIQDYFQRLSQSNIGNGLEIGEKAPDFCLSDSSGNRVCLHEYLGKGPVVLSFYRGDWCPFCRIELEGQEEIINHIQSAGGTLFALGP